MVLLEKPSKQIEDIHANGYLKFFVIRLLTNAIHGKYSPFDKHRIFGFESDEKEEVDDTDYSDKWIKEIRYNCIESVLNRTYWYERQIFEMWFSGNSARSINRQTKIAVNEVLRVIKKVKQEIIEEYGTNFENHWNSIVGDNNR